MSGGKRAASSELAEEPDAKAAKLDDSADAKEKPAELAEEAADQEGEDGDAAPTRRSSRARKAPAKGRDAPGKAAKGAEPKMVTVTYKEGDVLGEHLHAVGTLVEVKIPAESTVSGNPQVRARQLWGTDTYTSDSDLVAVLMHCGYYLPGATTPPSLVELRAVVRAVAPLESYASASRNGVRSRAWGAVRRGPLPMVVESCDAVLSAAKAKERSKDGAFGVGEPNGAGPKAKGPGAKRAAAAAAAAAADVATTTTVHLSPDPDRFHLATTPTFFPNNVESVVNTRASAANSERRGKLVREVTVQYNLRNEPWLKYSSAAVADRGFKRSEWTAARLRSESLYLESHAHRYELSFEGDPNACDEEGKGLASEDKYRFARCVAPRTLTETTRLGVPLPSGELEHVKAGLKWSDVTFGAGSVVVKGTEIKVVRLQFMART